MRRPRATRDVRRIKYNARIHLLQRFLPPTTMAVEESEERLAKFFVHETVRDGIAATGDVSQQLHQTDAGATYDRVHKLGREKVPRIDHMQRRPAHEEFQNYHKEHPDHLQHRERKRERDLCIRFAMQRKARDARTFLGGGAIDKYSKRVIRYSDISHIAVDLSFIIWKNNCVKRWAYDRT